MEGEDEIAELVRAGRRIALSGDAVVWPAIAAGTIEALDGLELHNVKAERATYLGRPDVRIVDARDATLGPAPSRTFQDCKLPAN